MTKTEEHVILITLNASEGYVLTQADDELNPLKRVFATQIIIGNNDSPENWKEITDEEAKVLEDLKLSKN